MAAIEYDLDCTGGLMEQIQKLVAPPESELPQRKRRAREYRRQGRSVNHDCCDSCREGGDLICCDRCPAAFHMQCHDPPLDDEDVPPGEWLCHRCTVNPPPPEPVEVDEDAMSTCSSHSRKSASSSLRRQVLSWQRSHTSSPSIVDMELPSDSEDEDEPSHPLLKLAKAAKMMNPKQMVLAKEVGCAVQLPGSSKRKMTYRDSGRWGNKKQAHELDNGMVPLPAKLCFLCTKSCRKGPLIQCDYCPLLFHMDCLDPPVSTLPSGRWMCPNHVEHALDEKLLKSVRLSERVKLWNKYTGPVNHHAVKIQFLNKIHRKNPPFRIKIHHRREKRVVVPPAIKAQYLHRAPLLHRASESETVGADVISGSLPIASHTTSQEEQEEWLLSVVGLQTNIARHLAQQQLNKDLPLSSLSTSTTSKPTASVQPVKQERVDTALSVATVHPLSDSKSKDSDNKFGVINGALVSSVAQDLLGNGALSATTVVSTSVNKPNGPMSLLQSSSSGCTANGDMDMLKSSDLLKPGCAAGAASSTHKVVTTGPGQSVVKLTVPCTPGSTGLTQSRNILISTVNKMTGAMGSKVVTASPAPQAGKVVHTSSSVAKNIPGSNSTSLLSPRVGTTGKMSGTTTGKVTVVSSTTNTSGSKVITVTTPAMAKAAAGSLTTKTVTPASLSSSPAIINLNNTLQACVDGTGEVELGKLDERLVQILAWQRLQQLLPQKNSQTLQQPKKASTNTVSIHSGLGSTEVRARSLLCPLTGKGQPVPMPYRSLTIGTGGDMDVCLTQFGHCNFVSAKHACIFYDETTRHYELLNYSEHGTTVDNVLYSCDFSEKTVSPPQPTNVVHSVRKLIAKSRRKEEPPESPTKPFMCAHSNEVVPAIFYSRRTHCPNEGKLPHWNMDHPSTVPRVRHTCSCKASSSSLIGGSGAGWEGTALLHHGSYIKVGCLQFVFSIVEQAVRDPMMLEKKPAGTSLLKATLRSPSFSS